MVCDSVVSAPAGAGLEASSFNFLVGTPLYMARLLIEHKLAEKGQQLQAFAADGVPAESLQTLWQVRGPTFQCL